MLAMMTLAAAAAGGVLGFLHLRLQRRQSSQKMVSLIDAQLPQLQCGECDYPGCRPYAEAIAREEADINQCPPGGVVVAGRLAELMNVQAPKMPPSKPRKTAYIREEDCLGCALCLPVCPTDAIVGAARYAHTVLAEDCVGCELCLAPCPADCIEMK